MKANKRLITALLAVLTIFVLVPTMAFADTAANGIQKWGDKYATVTDTDDHVFQTERVFSDGLVTATAQDDDAVAGNTYKAPVTSDGVVATAHFYDFDGSSFVYNNGKKWVALDGATMTQAYFKSLALGVQVVEQNYTKPFVDKVKGYEALTYEFNSTWAKDADEDFYAGEVKPANYTISIESSAYTDGLATDQTVEIAVKKIKANGKVDPANAATPDITGTVAKATITVKGENATPETAKCYIDSADSVFNAKVDGGKLVAPYDGAEHTVVFDTVPGYTVAYEVYDATTGKYNKADTVTIKDVQKDAIEVKATYTNTKTKATVAKTFTVNLTPAKATIGFDNDASITDTGLNWYSVEGSEYNAQDYIAVTPAEIAKDKIAAKDPQRAMDIAQNAAYKAAVEANKAEIIAWFNEAYDITATPRKSDANKVDLKIEAKNLSAKEQKALEDKYATLFQNMGKITLTAEIEATVFLNNTDVLAPEIEFVDSPTAMKFKAKKLKKKAASFTVTAVSSNNEPVTYKLINAPAKIKIDKATGMITLAKKLKKGTYKITVKAYIPKAYKGLNGGTYYPSETHAIKIKVK